MHGKYVNGIYEKIESERDRLRIGNGSWTINLEEINRLTVRKGKINLIRYITEEAVYEITPEQAKLKGFRMTLGDELKLVVPAIHWNTRRK